MRPAQAAGCLAALALAAAPAAVAQLSITPLLGHHAVVQQGRPVPVWGRAAAGSRVAVALGGHEAEAVTDSEGRWGTTLPALPAGGPYELVATSAAGAVRARALLAGDVWVASGQSNMAWRVEQAAGADAAITQADDLALRHFRVPLDWADHPQPDVAGGAWETATPEHVGDFSAVAYAFAREIRAATGVPVGILNASWGGSRIQPWMSAEMLGLDAPRVAAVFDSARAELQAREDALRPLIGDLLPRTDAGLTEDGAPWADPDLDDSEGSGWRPIAVPAAWEDEGYPQLDGIGWYRTRVTLTDDEAAAGVTLGAGEIDDNDHTFVNGVLVGRTRAASGSARVYPVAPSVLRAGANTIAVRVEDYGGPGGIKGDPAALFVELADGTRRALGLWRFRVGVVEMSRGATNQIPMALWNQMVHPLTRVPVAGVIWYQGESNTGQPDAYRSLFPAMIAGWREAWQQPELPFLWVQLAGYAGMPEHQDWPALRAAQSAALALPHTAEAVAYDTGEADDIHPRDKQTVGHRLALAARAVVYGETDLAYSGPRYRSYTVEGDALRLQFDHAGSGLVAREGLPLGGFALAGADGEWHEASARIDGSAIVLTSSRVSSPRAARYAWEDFPASATLTNAEGLPAAPFSISLRPDEQQLGRTD